jgi:site-specific DNA-methyltransferase (adenine-specific)
MAILYEGDCLESMKNLEDNSVDAILTDPPYGLGFMSKQWDKGVPGIEFWSEMLRIMKPGAYLLAFGGTRTYHRLAVAIEDSGFEMRDMIAWVYGQGFPKSHKVGEGGYGTALKPALEPIVMARKPIEKGLTVNQNASKWGTGGLNIDACRVPSGDEVIPINRFNSGAKPFGGAIGEEYTSIMSSEGRWPANLIHDGSEEVTDLFPYTTSGAMSGEYNNTLMTNSRGERTGKKIKLEQRASSGSGARFFYCAKASPKEKGDYNKHPTVKPIELMCYLLKLILPPNYSERVVLDPFAGSGTTGVAAKKLGVGNVILMEKETEYCDIIARRLYDMGS